ncbi:hypothetical protein D3C84_780260 [compost metagenome]
MPTPSPVPGPITTAGLPGSAMPGQICTRSWSFRRVMPRAMAEKSLTNSSSSTLRVRQKAERLRRQWLLVKRKCSPLTGPATARHTDPRLPKARPRPAR